MAVAPALLVLLEQLLPYLAAGAVAALGVAFTLLGLGPKLADSIKAAFQALGAERTRRLTQVREELQQAMAMPLTREALSAQGFIPDSIARQVYQGITATALSFLPPVEYLTFSTLAEADQWVANYRYIWSQGLITDELMYSLEAHYSRELQRLYGFFGEYAPAAPAAPTVPGYPYIPGAEMPTPPPAAVVAPAAPTLQTIVVQAPAVTVAPTVVNVAAPSVVVQAPPAAQVGVTNVVDTATLARALTSALPLVGSQLAQGILSQGQNLGHLLQLGRNQCFSGTIGSMMQLLLPTALGVFSTKVLLSEDGLGGFISEQMRKWFEGALDPGRFPQPATTETVFATAAARLREALSFGLQAHMWAVLGESNYIMKNLGLPQVAGFLAEMAGFGRLAAATLGQVETAALMVPMRLLAQRTYRPNIPGLGDLEEMYAKKEIPFEAASGIQGLHQALALHGLSDEWANVYREHLWKDPRLGEIIRIGQFFTPSLVPALASPTPETASWMTRAGISEAYINSPDWYYAWRAAKGGYDPRDIPILVETAKRAVCRREQTLFLDGVTRLARDGFIAPEKARELTLEAWEFSNPISARMRAIELQQDYKLLTDTRSAVLMAMSRGIISREEARGQLGKLGMAGERVELEVLKATLGMLPGMRITIARPEEVLEEAGLEVE